MKIDLHLHSTASDGKLSPKDLVLWAKNRGLETIALTDHDTVSGIDEAKEECKKQGINFVVGIELSSFGKFETHILGYNFDYQNPNFLSELEVIKKRRIARNILLKEKLEEFGMKLDINPQKYGIGRMHFAREMVEKGYVKTINSAFDQYLGSNGKAYIKSQKITPFEAVELIKKYGGVAVIAHPKRFLQDKNLADFVDGLTDFGLMGLEVYYPNHNETDTAKLKNVALSKNLIMTGGSDFHGDEVFRYPSFELEERAKKLLGIN